MADVFNKRLPKNMHLTIAGDTLDTMVGFLKDMQLLNGKQLGHLISSFRCADVKSESKKAAKVEEEDLSSLDEL